MFENLLKSPILQVAFPAMIFIGVVRLFVRFKKQRKGSMPAGDRLTMKWVRRQAKWGSRVQAMRGYSQLTGASMAEAKEAVERLAKGEDVEPPRGG